jgi:hypothetical protein
MTLHLRPPAALLLLVPLVACAPDEAQPDPDVVEWNDAWPDDTIIMVGDVPITASQVMAWVPTIAQIHRQKSEGDHIRQALTNLVLHNAIAAQVYPAGRDRAREQAQTWLETLESGEELPAEGPQVERMHGAWNERGVDIGLDRWGTARTLDKGEWTMIETLGGFTVMRVVGKPTLEQWHPSVPVTIEQITDYYLEPETVKDEIDGLLDGGLKIRVVDKDWENYLPVHYLHRGMDSGE